MLYLVLGLVVTVGTDLPRIGEDTEVDEGRLDVTQFPLLLRPRTMTPQPL